MFPAISVLFCNFGVYLISQTIKALRDFYSSLDHHDLALLCIKFLRKTSIAKF